MTDWTDYSIHFGSLSISFYVNGHQTLSDSISSYTDYISSLISSCHSVCFWNHQTIYSLLYDCTSD